MFYQGVRRYHTESFRTVEARGASLTYSSIACKNDAGGLIINKTQKGLERHLQWQLETLHIPRKVISYLLNFNKFLATSHVNILTYFVKL